MELPPFGQKTILIGANEPDSLDHARSGHRRFPHDTGSNIVVANQNLRLNTGPENVDVRRIVIVEADHDLKSIEAQDGWHDLIIPNVLGFSQFAPNCDLRSLQGATFMCAMAA
jgi:hypothetical protein